MSVLHYKSRPWVVFDPNVKDHRKWFAEFQDTGTWGRCPVRFIVPEDHGDLITMIQRSLIQYYVKQEFCVAKKPRRMVAQKAKKRLTKNQKGTTIELTLKK